MRILVVSQYYYPEPFRINEMCEELVKRGHAVTVLTANPNYPEGEFYKGYKNEYREETIKGVQIIRSKCRSRHKGALNLALNYVDFVFQSSNCIRKLEGEFDVIYMYQLSPITSCIPAIKYKKKKNIPLFLYCLDVWPESLKGSAFDRWPFFPLVKKMSKYIYASADKIAVSSPSFSRYLSELCNIDVNLISVQPQHSREIVLKKDDDNVFSDYMDCVNFVFLGNIGESQNVECLIEAASLIHKKSSFKLHIVGSGSYLEVCKNVAKELKVEDNVIFYGRRPSDEMPDFYKMADVCMVSLKDEGFVGYTIPGKLQEYMSAGKAILGCINGDAATVIEDADCGYCVSASDVKGLAETMTNMIENKEQLKVFGKNAKDYYYKYFTLKSHINDLEIAFNKLVEVRK